MSEFEREESASPAWQRRLNESARRVMRPDDLKTYGLLLVQHGFRVWWTSMGTGPGYLQYQNPANGCWGSVQHSETFGWQHLMPIVSSVEYGSAMFAEDPEDVWTVAAAVQCAQPHGWNRMVGWQPARRDPWRSAAAVALHEDDEEGK